MNNSNYTGPMIIKSYTVELRLGKPTVEESGWVPGYTDAHKATVIEALEYAVMKTEGMIIQLEANRDDLLDKIKAEKAKEYAAQVDEHDLSGDGDGWG